MDITIRFSTDNAAFHDNPQEIADILKEAATKIDLKARERQPLRDSNGNTVGYVETL